MHAQLNMAKSVQKNIRTSTLAIRYCVHEHISNTVLCVCTLNQYWSKMLTWASKAWRDKLSTATTARLMSSGTGAVPVPPATPGCPSAEMAEAAGEDTPNAAALGSLRASQSFSNWDLPPISCTMPSVPARSRFKASTCVVWVKRAAFQLKIKCSGHLVLPPISHTMPLV